MSASIEVAPIHLRLLRLTRNEMTKFLAQWWVWIVWVLPIVVAIALPLSLGLGEEWRRATGDLDELPVGGVQCLADTLHGAFYLGGFALLIYSAQIVSGERGQGQLRDLLGGPVARLDVALAKWLSLGLVFAGLYAGVIIASVASTAYFFDFEDVTEEGALLLEIGEFGQEVARALALHILPSAALFTCGFLVSSCTSNAGVSAAVAIVGMGLLEFAKGALGTGPRYRHYLFNDWLPSPFRGDAYLDGLRGFSRGMSDALWPLQGPELARSLWVPGATVAAALGLSLLVWWRKEFAE